MSSGTVKPGSLSKPGQGGLPAVAPTSQTILLDKLNARRSTPDSEALASSDDEADSHRHDPHPAAAQPHRPVRRASWLNDTTSQAVSHPRKGSFASSSMSPTTSHPTTPSADAGAGSTWGAHPASSGVLNRGLPGSSSFPWGPVWANERKEPPSRLAEVLPSPSSAFPSGVSSHSLYSESSGLSQTSPGPRDQGANSQIPFAIPLHPTPKTYRSQSYSVGQLEPDAATTAMGPSAAVGSRCRPTPHSGLQHRPSRPSMLSEMASDGSMLGKVNEDEDDDDSTGSMPGSQQRDETVEERLERLTRENTILKQREQQHLYQNSRMRPRASSSAAYALGNGYIQEPVPEESSDYAIDELDESHDASELAARRGLARRMSEFGAGPFRSPYGMENRKLDPVKKAIWQSSLGFGGLGDISQSRRHSFADVPQRQGSIASIADSVGPHDQVPDTQHSQDFPSPYSENPNFPTAHQVSSYFPGGPGLANSQQAIAQSAYGGGGGQFPSPYAAMHAQYAANRPTSPPRNMYALSQPRHNQLLHIVLFKCARADVFYIQEGTGLTVKPGDLVIVEADRGTDLGTVAKDNVDWQTAKELKEHYAEEQYKWLMMYSQNAGAAQAGHGAGLMVASNGMQGSAVGGMGPPNPHHMQEPNSGELKPKLIKRLAQSHEIHALRDKEGNEAKAKRVCMQKVKEHGLNMEILDAEFQMDWKKLTFYYFADSYINFNSLVTDLFKIYKTRIWMSAINPASFASPTLGLQAPSGIGPGAVGVGRGSGATAAGAAGERRPNPQAAEQQQQQQQQQQPPSGFSSMPNHQNQNNRVVRPSNSHSSFNEMSGMPPPSNYNAAAAANSANYSYNPYGNAFQTTSRPPGTLPYTPAGSMMQGMDQFQSGFPQSSDYHLGRGRFPTPQSGGVQHDQGVSPLSQQAEWVGAFQGLSL